MNSTDGDFGKIQQHGLTYDIMDMMIRDTKREKGSVRDAALQYAL